MRMILRVRRIVGGQARRFDIFHGGIDAVPRDGQKMQVFTGCGDATSKELMFRVVTSTLLASTGSQHMIQHRGVIVEAEPMPGDALAWTNSRIDSALKKEGV